MSNEKAFFHCGLPTTCRLAQGVRGDFVMPCLDKCNRIKNGKKTFDRRFR